MKIDSIALAGTAATVVLFIGVLTAPYVFADRIVSGVWLGDHNVSGLKLEDLSGALKVYEEELLSRTVKLRLRDKEAAYAIKDLGFSLNKEATIESILQASDNAYLPMKYKVQPTLSFDEKIGASILRNDFYEKISWPKNASLTIDDNDNFILVESKKGEQIDTKTLKQEIISHTLLKESRPIDLTLITSDADIQNHEVESAKALAEELLRDGITLSFEDQTFNMRPFTIRRLLEFTGQNDPEDIDNKILGVRLEPEGLAQYFETTIVPSINREPVNARFEIEGDRVDQFAVPQNGQILDIETTTETINNALRDNITIASLAVDIVEPNIRSNEDIEALGLTTLLASGESDFAGSPPNRVHNIHVGAARYHGLLIEPDQEFSFNEFLGPVTAAAGYKPELVIKSNQTVPEYGGGLCQVSTTIFRAAMHTGLEITQRRNHSYAVQYYDTPGFDATIYPPYTDLRFLNNTPGYILVQVRITGTRIAFEFWGTHDGREVIVSEPYIYDRQPNGAMKATVTQTVTRNGQKVIEDTFYSNYRSPDLFPRVLAEDGARPVQAD